MFQGRSAKKEVAHALDKQHSHHSALRPSFHEKGLGVEMIQGPQEIVEHIECETELDDVEQGCCCSCIVVVTIVNGEYRQGGEIDQKGEPLK